MSSYVHIYTMLEEIFESSILEADTTELISNIGELYDCFNGQGFEESFKKILTFILSESGRSNEISKLLHFIAESMVTLDNKYKTAAAKEDEEIDDIVHPLLKGLFKALCNWSEASSWVVRLHSCQLLYTLLTYIQDHGLGEIDTETYEQIGSLIESRRRDVRSNVRAHAVLLSKFFQDPSTVNDPVITALCWQMQYDPNPRVRQNIVSIIAACEETIIPIAIRFLYDKHPGVRNAALLHICKRIGPRSFAPAQRILILHKCFTDSSDVIRHNAEQKLIPVWFKACGNKLCTFFKLLRVNDNESLETNIPFFKELISILLKYMKVSQIIEEIELDMTSCLPKLPLSGEKVFLWRNLFINSNKNEKLSVFIAPLSTLIPFIIKCFDDASSSEVEVCVFAELLLFLMDIMETSGIRECGGVFPMVLTLMRHPFVPKELMPYLVTLYLSFSPKEKDIVLNDIVEVVEDLKNLMLFTKDQEKNIVLKCFAIASQVLMEETSITPAIKNIKDNLIIPYLNSEDDDIKCCATSALTLYCLLDIREAKLSWSIFKEAIDMESGPLKNCLFEGLFDILLRHGSEIFADLTSNGQEKLECILTDVMESFEGEDNDEIILNGILKLYMNHKIESPSILAEVIALYFSPDDYASTQCRLKKFFPLFGAKKEGCDCLVQSFLNLIDLLFDASKNSPLHEINIKKTAVQLLEFSKSFEQKQSKEEKFQDLLILKLCKKFLKKPWRLSACDLYSVCCHIVPEKIDTLLRLKEIVVRVTESLESSLFLQKNPYSKKSAKGFASYLKRIQEALKSAPLLESSRKEKSPVQKRLEYDSSTLQDASQSGDSSSVSEILGSQSDVSESSAVVPSTGIPVPLETQSPTKVAEPTPSKTVTRNRLSRKTPGPPAKKALPENTFKTPGPQRNKLRRQKLDITLTKTC